MRSRSGKMARAVAVVVPLSAAAVDSEQQGKAGRGASPTCAGRANLSHTSGLQNLPSPSPAPATNPPRGLEPSIPLLTSLVPSLALHQRKIGPGFRKIDPDRWEFANEGFLRGQRHLLRMIKRRRPPSNNLSTSHQQQQQQQYPVEVGQYGGLDEELDRLRRDKSVLLAEVVKLRQEQQSTRADMRAVEERLQRAEGKQVQMMGFLARAMHNPGFFQHLLAQNQDRLRIRELGLEEEEDAFSHIKRRRPIDIVPFAAAAQHQQRGEELGSSSVLFGPGGGEEFEKLSSSEPAGRSELENLALNIQGLGKRKQDHEQQQAGGGGGGGRNNNNANQGGETAELTDDFWEELLNEGMRDELSMPEMMERRRPPGRYVDALAQKLSYLSNSTAK
ncbi:hypothetical protein PR202_gb18661 [Eleusine coracana subsp. coracana]|uniref:Uncharacterized protein n=1 Tax=Eleusine coracana subsp. coracana TaxID=191504 RepID=A0AAV5F663_ELECO|nr:hypothetical protein PR202_gb18661 [Eleusine coracana subsp. coracana]